jgi:hypothetical protein
MDWGYDGKSGRFVPLEPLETDMDLDKSFRDENGVLRADHRERCGGMPLHVERLSKKVPAALQPDPEPEPDAKRRRWRLPSPLKPKATT